jgi:hypothetical protein
LSDQWQQPAGQPAGGWQQQQPGGQASGGWQQPAGQSSGGWPAQGQHAGQPAGAWQGQQQAGGLHLRTGFFPLAFILYLFKPRCSIDGGAEFPIQWGDNHIPVPSGRHHVRVWFPYMFISQCGPAETLIEIPESGMALEYKAPTWWVFSKGKMLIPGYGPAPAGNPQAYGPQQGYGAQQAYAGQPQHAAQAYAGQSHQATQAAAGGGNPAGWHADPTGRYEQRYWDGQGWTAHVVRGGVQASDPI